MYSLNLGAAAFLVSGAALAIPRFLSLSLSFSFPLSLPFALIFIIPRELDASLAAARRLLNDLKYRAATCDGLIHKRAKRAARTLDLFNNRIETSRAVRASQYVTFRALCANDFGKWFRP